MAYRRFYRASKPSPRAIEVKFAGDCMACGGRIAAGEIATYYPAGTIAGVHTGKIAHCGGLDGTSARCSAELRKKHESPLNDFAGDGLDARYEDFCRDACGL